MSSKTAPERPARAWSLAIRLTAYYVGSAFLIVLLATGFLYWAMVRGVDLEDDHTLADKIRLLHSILQAHPLDTSAIAQEVNESWQTRQNVVVFLRVFAADGALIAESPDMQTLLPHELFPPAATEPGKGSNIETQSGQSFRLMAVGSREQGLVEVALDRTQEEELLQEYQESLGYVLGVALLACGVAGYWIAQRGLRPIHDISTTAGRIRPTNLAERIPLAGLPGELHRLARTFNDMLDRLEAGFDRLSRFSADIAHELRTPLSNLRGELDVALERERTPEQYAQTIGSGLEECGRLARIIDSLLFLARAEDPQIEISRETFDVAAELENVRDFFGAMAHESGVAIRLEGRGPFPVEVNRPLVQQAVGNLVANALAHTPPGGTVTLRAADDGKSVSIDVADTGCGIAAVDLPHVFNRFYRADRSRSSASGGVGLGLAIVKCIAELHDGSVEVASEPGRGTRVRLFLPKPGEKMTGL
jgi:two-component system heavy metal sensor histidine kinase CusS